MLFAVIHRKRFMLAKMFCLLCTTNDHLQDFERLEKRESKQANRTALAYFDCESRCKCAYVYVYAAIGSGRYGELWPSIRLGMLSPAKYVCVVNSIISRQPDSQVDRQLTHSGWRLDFERRLALCTNYL